MRKSFRTFLAVLIAVVALCFFGVWLWFGGTSDPKLSVRNIRTIDGHGHWTLQFGITNTGHRTVFTSERGQVEVFNHTNLLSVGATSPMGRLRPGEGQVVDAVLSASDMNSIDGKWRYICLYAADGLRPRIYRWQWGPKGPGARVNWLIPQWLKGMPLTVKGTSDWIEEAKP
jgi:hypothetical protein